jgi:hypothetical protein
MRRRAEFPASVKREALERSNGICECHLIPHVFEVACGLPLGPGNTFFEHLLPDNISKDNSISNAAVLTKTCWRYKTVHHDLPIIAKAKRNFDAHNGIHRPRRHLPGWRGDPFKFTPGSTTPIDRRTGRPWRGSQ